MTEAEWEWALTGQETKSSNSGAHAINTWTNLLVQAMVDCTWQLEHLLTLKDDWVCLKVKVEDRIRQRKVQRRQGDNRLVQDHAEGPCHRDDKHFSKVSTLHLQRRQNARVTRVLAQFLCSALQDHRAIGLGHEDHQGQGYTRTDESDPETPSPADDRDEPRDPGSHDGSKRGALRTVSKSRKRHRISNQHTAM